MQIARAPCQLLTSAGGKYSKFAKKQGREYKRKEDLESEWLGKAFEHAQQKTCYMAALQEATRLLNLYSAKPTSAAVPLLQHPAATMRTVQQLLVTCVQLAMMAPREPVLMAFKLQWLCGKDGCYQINPGMDSEDFKNLNWKGGAVPIRTELAEALRCYGVLSWPWTAPHFGGGMGFSAGKAGAADAVALHFPGVDSNAAFKRLRNTSPLFFEGVPDAIDTIGQGHGNSSPAALAALAGILANRNTALRAKRGISMHALRRTFVDWLGMYSDYDHNTARHVASWTAYTEWHEQLQFDIQGLPNPYLGMSYHEHAQRASDIMGHAVAIHEQTYMPISPSHMTRAEELAHAAAAEPLPAAAAATSDAATEPDEEYEEY